MFDQLPIYQQKGKSAFNGKLNNILLFASHLENPHKKFKSIHVAGTNGKGSSSHMLASILQEAGYKVGLYTSPHLKDFRERIRINGMPVPKRFVIHFISEHRKFFELNQLSFFEMTVGMAFSFFAEMGVDIAIIEVGLGGRLDSTNIITPEVALITNIGLDHIDILGDTLQKIALEKSGIIKHSVPVVVSETQNEVKKIFETVAEENKAPLTFADKSKIVPHPTDLLGSYQIKNVRGVLAALNQLKGYTITNKQLKKGLLNVAENTGLKGRYQVLAENPKIICDTAHNLEGLKIVMQQLQSEKFEKLHIVFGLVKEKDFNGILNVLPKSASYYFCAAKNKRSQKSSFLKKQGAQLGREGKSYASVKGALKAAMRAANKRDLIYIGGSNFVVAEVL